MLVAAGDYEEVITLATQSEDCLRTAALWACWLGKCPLLTQLLMLNKLDLNTRDDVGRSVLLLYI